MLEVQLACGPLKIKQIHDLNENRSEIRSEIRSQIRSQIRSEIGSPNTLKP